MTQVEIPDGVTLPGAMRPPETHTSLQVVAVPLRAWRLIAGIAVAAAVLAVVIYRFVPPTYTATTSFVPEGTQFAIAVRVCLPHGRPRWTTRCVGSFWKRRQSITALLR